MDKDRYTGGVTRHVLHLIDHGAKCAGHGGMRFTNHRCHCKQEWKDKAGKTHKFPKTAAHLTEESTVVRDVRRRALLEKERRCGIGVIAPSGQLCSIWTIPLDREKWL